MGFLIDTLIILISQVFNSAKMIVKMQKISVLIHEFFSDIFLFGRMGVFRQTIIPRLRSPSSLSSVDIFHHFRP